MMDRRWLLCMMLSLAGLDSVESAPVRSTKTYPVTCPAVTLDIGSKLHVRASEPHEPFLSWEAVVLGLAKKPHPESSRVELTVDRVLAGSCPKRIPDIYCEIPDNEQRGIFHIHSGTGSGRWGVFVWTLTVTEADGLAALWTAMLDYHTLSAKSIVVGTLPSFDSTRSQGYVEVSRFLHGEAKPKGSRVLCQFYRTGLAKRVIADPAARPRIYFVDWTWSLDDLPPPEEGKPLHPQYSISLSLPMAMEASVREALNRRKLYPLTGSGLTHDKKRFAITHGERSRVIIHRGPLRKVIDFADSEEPRVRALAYCTLFQRRRESKRMLVETIGKEMRRPSKTGYRRLRGLIEVLGLIGEVEPEDGSLRVLVERMLDYIDSGSPDSTAGQNDALLWLVRAMPARTVFGHFGRRMVRLRDKTRGAWRQRLQAALDEVGVEDQLEVLAGLKRMKGVRPTRRASPWFQEPTCPNTFTPDGAHLLQFVSGRVRVWRVRDWSVLRTHPLEGDTSSHCFSPDGRWLYVGLTYQKGWNAESMKYHSEKLLRLDWRTGNVARRYPLENVIVGGLRISSDGQRLGFRTLPKARVGKPTTENAEFVVLDVDTGRTLMTMPCRWPGGLRMHPSLKWGVVRSMFDSEKEPGGWSYVWHRLTPDGKGAEVTLFRRAREVRFLDEKLVLTVEHIVEHDDEDRKAVLHLLRVIDWARNEVVASKEVPWRDVRSALTPDGKWLAVDFDDIRPVDGSPGTWRHQQGAALFEAHSLRLVRQLPVETATTEASAGFLVHPNGKQALFTSRFRKTPRLVDFDAAKVIDLGPGHRTAIGEVLFARDGTILTRGKGNRLCWWDAETLRLLRTRELPRKWWILAVRNDGEVCACYEAGADSDPKFLRLVSTKTGKVLTSMKLAMESYQPKLRFVWRSDSEGLLFYTRGVESFSIRRGLIRFDLETGKELGRANCPDGRWCGELRIVADRLDDWLVQSVGDRSVAMPVTFALSKAAVEERPKKPFPGSASLFGFVPRSSRVWMGFHPWRMLDFETLKTIWERPFPKNVVQSATISPDGRRCALSASLPFYDDAVSSWLAPDEPESVVRVHDAKTGKTLFAFRPSGKARLLRFDANGKRLVVVTEEETLEVWKLPKRR